MAGSNSCNSSSRSQVQENVHTLGAAGYPSSLRQAVQLSLAGVLGLALHVIIVVVAASCADEEGGRQQRRRGGTNLLDLGNVVRERRGVDEHLLVESATWLVLLSRDVANVPSGRLNDVAARSKRPDQHTETVVMP